MEKINIKNIGLIDYKTSWSLQKQLQKDLTADRGRDTLILCEHPPTITLGKSANKANIIAPELLLKKENVKTFEIERGGDVTYHGPGQLVCYPIIDLRKKKTDVSWYLRSLEQVIISTLQDFDIKGFQICDRTGVWTAGNAHDKKQGPKKIASIGVRLSRWCTLHGFSLNVRDCRDGFSLIYPCGFNDIEVTSIEQETKRTVTLEDVAKRIEHHFCDVFEYRSSAYGSRQEENKQENGCEEENCTQKYLKKKNFAA